MAIDGVEMCIMLGLIGSCMSKASVGEFMWKKFLFLCACAVILSSGAIFGSENFIPDKWQIELDT